MSPWRAGRRWSAGFRSGWRGSRRRRGSNRPARRRTPRREWADRSVRRSSGRGLLDVLLVLVLADVDVCRPELVPGLVALGGGGVLALERLVARIVGDTLGEVRAVRRLHHPVGHQPVDANRRRRP